jgi:hypothetical protein
VGRVDLEAEAHEEWRWLGHSSGLAQANLAGPAETKEEFKLNFGIWQGFEILYKDLEGIWTGGLFLNSSRLSRDFRKMKYDMP